MKRLIFKKFHYVNEFKYIRAFTKQGSLYTLILRLKFSDKDQYEIDTLISNLNYCNKEVNIIIKEHSDPRLSLAKYNMIFV